MIDIKLSSQPAQYKSGYLTEKIFVRKGEKNAVRVLLPVTEWLQEFPNGSPEVVYVSPGATSSSIGECEVVSWKPDCIGWMITSDVTAVAGTGMAEFRWIDEDVVVCSAIINIVIEDSLSAPTLKVPTPAISLLYNGEEQSMEWNYYDSRVMSIGGQISGTQPGTYIASFTPTATYTWEDGTSNTVQVAWTIAAVDGVGSNEEVLEAIDKLTALVEEIKSSEGENSSSISELLTLVQDLNEISCQQEIEILSGGEREIQTKESSSVTWVVKFRPKYGNPTVTCSKLNGLHAAAAIYNAQVTYEQDTDTGIYTATVNFTMGGSISYNEVILYLEISAEATEKFSAANSIASAFMHIEKA